jgi:hypothetical protein
MSGWRKSSHSEGNGGACVECASDATGIMVRDTTDRGGLTLSVPAGVWTAFLATIR